MFGRITTSFLKFSALSPKAGAGSNPPTEAGVPIGLLLVLTKAS